MSFQGKKVLALIPARKGSKGIKDKNIYHIQGKLLIDFTIDAAVSSKYIDQVFVSTNHDKIIEHCDSKKVTVIKRPDSLCTDRSTAVDVVNHFLDHLNELESHDKSSDFFITYLQPTSPLRSNKHINESFKLLKKNDSSALIAVVENTHTPFKSFLIKGNKAQSLFDESMTNLNRQSLPPTYRANGSIYTFLKSKFTANKGFPSNGSTAFLMKPEDSLDIDSYGDIDTLESVLIKPPQ